jgi:hypothetical protein
MRTDFLKAALCVSAFAVGAVAGTAEAYATSRKAEKAATQAASTSRDDIMRSCRKQSYARTPGGNGFVDGYMGSDARLREITLCYQNGGRLM